ncbi:MAG: TetR/AcrR family transcriptional regulator [Candidatus Dormibacteraeota bacterium]|nr:TetR/AcrR family transcriptional regulator [Candidatus Dormibacteraeota bacterium]
MSRRPRTTDTPRQTQGRRRRLEAAALRLFTERGFHDTSIDDIVAAARTSKSAFYVHFRSKEDCFRSLLEREGGALMAAADRAARGAGEGHRAHLRGGIHGFVRCCLDQAAVARLLLVESVGLSPGIEAVRARLHGDFARNVEAEVRRGQTVGEFLDADASVFGRAVVGAVNEVVAGALASDADEAPEALAAELCRIFGV